MKRVRHSNRKCHLATPHQVNASSFLIQKITNQYPRENSRNPAAPHRNCPPDPRRPEVQPLCLPRPHLQAIVQDSLGFHGASPEVLVYEAYFDPWTSGSLGPSDLTFGFALEKPLHELIQEWMLKDGYYFSSRGEFVRNEGRS